MLSLLNCLCLSQKSCHYLIVSVHHRNEDLKEVTVEVNGKVELKFAIAYGFRNIQNIVQKMKRGKLLYQFVELMACPAGQWTCPQCQFLTEVVCTFCKHVLANRKPYLLPNNVFFSKSLCHEANSVSD